MHVSVSAISNARAAYAADDIPKSERLCREILRDDPACADAWHLLGTTLVQKRQFDEGLAAVRTAAQLNPASPEILYTLAHTLFVCGQRQEAVARYRQVLGLRPDHAESLTNLGVALAEAKRFDEALPFLRRAVEVRPGLPKTHHNLGVALAHMDQPEEALACLETALRLDPDYAEASLNLGNVLKALGRLDEAIVRYEHALKLRPDHLLAYNNLGVALTEAGRVAEAVPILRQALRLRPDDPDKHINLGQVYAASGRAVEAEASFHEALRLDPRNSEAHHGLGNTYKEQGRAPEALACYQIALWLTPDSAATKYNRSLTLLQSGNYAEGWPAYEWRWQRKKAKQRTFTQPRWDGRPLEGRTILIWSEQGLGDSIQFVRYCALVKQHGGTVVLQCPGYLMPLLRTCPHADRVVAEEDPIPPYDVQVPLLSLPGLLGTTLDSVPAEVPYLIQDQNRIDRWAKQLASIDELKVGIEWQGNPYHQWDNHRSVPLTQFAPLGAIDGVRLISLQRVHGTEQLRTIARRFPVQELEGEVDPPGAAFLDTASVMKNLDLVITVDTAAAHLAGALGVPAWVALATVCDWRWMLRREDTPWYPTLRLFRQKRPGDWDEVFSRMAAELSVLAAGKTSGRDPCVRVAPGELIDRITILELKVERIADPLKLARVRLELAELRKALDRLTAGSSELARLSAELKVVNTRLWDTEDAIRRCEASEDFGPTFVALARSVYRQNDERSALKQHINKLLGSVRGDAKQYTAYQ
jgi:tetratricopeptide (TPR) repeat protein